MPDVLPTANRQPDTGRSFIANILSRLPYLQDSIDADQSNPRYELFDRLAKRHEYRVMQQSVITGPSLRQNEYENPGGFGTDHAYHKYIYASIDTDKIRRIAEYRRMASYAEIADCLDEICDEFLSKDDEDKYLKIGFSSFGKLDSAQRAEIEKEFYKFIQIFDLEHKGWGYCRQLLTEGEIFFENVVHERKKDLGIIGTLCIPGELINPVYDNIQNNVIENFIFQKPIALQQGTQNANNPAPPPSQSTPGNSLQQQLITFQGNQITYINSGMWNEDMSIRIPYIEMSRRAYKQVSLLEDAIVIYRMVRAPERLKFKIDVGNMPPAKAEAYLKQLMQSYWSKKTFDSQAGHGAGNVYDPQSMLDSYWFARRSGEQGSDVEMLNGGANLGEMKDLDYFVKKLYKSLKVPLTRMNPDEGYKDGSEILREELRFAKFIVRLQGQFASGLKDTFITHLKLRGWWKEYKLHESYFGVHFNPPSNYFAIRKNQEFELKYNNFNNLSQNESISKTFAQRHYLGLNDAKISENMEWLRKDAALRWELDQISQTGPNWREHIEAAEQASSSLGGTTPPPVGGGAGSSIDSGIPEFGGGGAGGEASATETAETATPETPAATQPAGETQTTPPAA
jgi:hypothetical protein